MRQAPIIATWLLRHFGCSENNEAVIGDLFEQHRHGRTRLWYSRQALRAIVVGVGQEVRAHKWVTIRALTTGWMVLLLYNFSIPAVVELFKALASWSRWWRFDSGYPVGFGGILCSVISGWLVAHLYRRRAAVLVYALSASCILFPWLYVDAKGLLFSPPHFFWLICNMGVVIGILLGGGLLAAGSRYSSAGKPSAI